MRTEDAARWRAFSGDQGLKKGHPRSEASKDPPNAIEVLTPPLEARLRAGRMRSFEGRWHYGPHNLIPDY